MEPGILVDVPGGHGKQRWRNCVAHQQGGVVAQEPAAMRGSSQLATAWAQRGLALASASQSFMPKCAAAARRPQRSVAASGPAGVAACCWRGRTSYVVVGQEAQLLAMRPPWGPGLALLAASIFLFGA
jgi:hypothetical protein